MSDLRPRDDRGASAPVVTRHGQLKRRSPWPRLFGVIGIVVAVALVSSISFAAITTYQLKAALDHGGVDIAADQDSNVDIGKISGGFNILIAGSDACTKDCKNYGKRSSALNDVNILLHVSEDQTNAVAVSFPRDLVLPIPACPKEVGSGTTPAQSDQPLNVALSDGGLNCVALTISKLTGLKIQFAGLITFGGVIAMSNAVGGVPVCVTKAVYDYRTGLRLKAGTTTLKGTQALAFLRTRHSFGDGSDLSRIGAQQAYMSSLVRTLKSKDTLGNVQKIYSLAEAAANNMTLSKNFRQPDTMVSIALALKGIKSKNITFVQYPSTTGVGGVYQGKVAPKEPDAANMLKYLKDDVPFTPKDLGTRGAVTEDPTSSASAPSSSTSSPSSSVTKVPTKTPTKTATPTKAPTKTATATATSTPTPTSTPVSVGSGSTGNEVTCINPN